MKFDKLILRNRTSIFLSTIFIALTLGLIRKFFKLFSVKEGNVIVIALHKLGDSVFTIPAILEIQNHFNKRLQIVCFNESVPIFKMRCKNSDFVVLNRKDFFFRSRIANRQAQKQISLLNPEVIIDLTGEFNSASLIYNSRAKTIIGICKQHLKPIYDIPLDIQYKSHISEQYLNLVPLIRQDFSVFNMEPTNTGPIKIDEIYIHPFAGWIAKEWGLNKFILLAEKLKKTYKVKIIVPSRRLPQDIIVEIENKKIDLIITHSIDDLISALQDCSLLICNDSGPIHIASLLKKATFTIFGPTNPLAHKPIGQQHGYIFNKIKCSPAINEKMCFTVGGRIGCPSNECLKTLQVNDVYSELQKFIVHFNETN